MEKDIAIELMSLAVLIDEPIARMFAVVERIENIETKARFKTAVGDLMGAIFRDIIFPIESLYPDLNPDRAPSLP